ncbi:uncharacterized protein BDV14DRAFT_204549 [Aspergillus stella-maris]|uniref:uncharacterized protein n=1 Tax=Aspergillus stella-maris TaxID=1810926 RepID=UPI003CCD7E7A
MGFPCTECTRELDTKSTWEDHVKTHTFEAAFICPECSDCIPKEAKSFARLHYTLRHKKTQKAADQVAEGKGNYVLPWIGNIWCKPCNRIVCVGGNASRGGISPEALAHHASHLPE